MLWLSDIHLNFLKPDERQRFYKTLQSDQILITGDIGESHNVIELLTEMQQATEAKIYFVAGNHDYYGSSITETRRRLRQFKSCHYLPKRPAGYKLSKKTVLVGQDGWGDCRNGDWENSHLIMADWSYIKEFKQERDKIFDVPVKTLQKYADKDAEKLTQSVLRAVKRPGVEKVIIASHVPPFEEACLYAGRKSTPSGLPFFSSQIFGVAMLPIVEAHPHINFLWLCGHTHSKCSLDKWPNFLIQVAEAQYFNPQVAGEIHV